MDYVKLPDLRRVVRGFDLRVDAARALSHVELASLSSMDKTPATDLRDFFIACANAADKAAGGSGFAVTLGGVVLSPTQAIITSGTKVTAPVTGSGTTGVTPTIAGGVVTGLALS